MKTITLKITILAVLLGLSACSSDKKAQLSKLKDQQSALTEQIKLLEKELKSENPEVLNADEFKFVGLTEAKSTEFDHFIRVQGKLDGDQNAAVSWKDSKASINLHQIFSINRPVSGSRRSEVKFNTFSQKLLRKRSIARFHL
jgi:hypothetical protein